MAQTTKVSLNIEKSSYLIVESIQKDIDHLSTVSTDKKGRSN